MQDAGKVKGGSVGFLNPASRILLFDPQSSILNPVLKISLDGVRKVAYKVIFGV
jgi:hypothetical protein